MPCARAESRGVSSAGACGAVAGGAVDIADRGTAERGARDRLPRIVERAAERSAGRGGEQSREQGNCVANEYHRAHREIPCVFVAEQIWRGDALRIGTA